MHSKIPINNTRKNKRIARQLTKLLLGIRTIIYYEQKEDSRQETLESTFLEQSANLAGNLYGVLPLQLGATVDGPSASVSVGDVDGMNACPPDGKDLYSKFAGSVKFKDNVGVYQCTEPALDYTMMSFITFARIVLDSPYSSPISTTAKPISTGSNSLSTGTTKSGTTTGTNYVSTGNSLTTDISLTSSMASEAWSISPITWMFVTLILLMIIVKESVQS